MGENTKEITKEITKKDLKRCFLRWYMSAEISNSFERLQSVSFCYSMLPVLRKLYQGKEEFKDALKRELQFFNTEAIWGTPIHGITIAMEEEKAKGENIPDSAITGIKTGLMGPLAGIGDTITWGMLKTIIYGIGCTMAATGNIMGALITLVFPLVTFLISGYLFNMGYQVGKESVKTILQAGWVKELILGTGILGMFMMGALSAGFVKLKLAAAIPVSGGGSIGSPGFTGQHCTGTAAPSDRVWHLCCNQEEKGELWNYLSCNYCGKPCWLTDRTILRVS